MELKSEDPLNMPLWQKMVVLFVISTCESINLKL
jgi:uncharacterized protein (UPF0147 family)